MLKQLLCWQADLTDQWNVNTHKLWLCNIRNRECRGSCLIVWSHPCVLLLGYRWFDLRVHLNTAWMLNRTSRLFTAVTSSPEWDGATSEKETCEKFPPSGCSSYLTHLCDWLQIWLIKKAKRPLQAPDGTLCAFHRGLDHKLLHRCLQPTDLHDQLFQFRSCRLATTT